MRLAPLVRWHCTERVELPRLIASSVVRGAQLEESHGGLCVVDFGAGTVDYVVDWNDTRIDVAGRGGDRGLRGIAVLQGQIYVLASMALLQFDEHFQLQREFRNQYLRHSHEISVHEGHAYIVSTGFDAVLVFELDSQQFVRGLHLCMEEGRVRMLAFDPRTQQGPQPSNVFHLNTVKCDTSGLYVAGLRTGGLLRLAKNQLTRVAALPAGTHNAQPFRGGLLYNDTRSDRVCAHFDNRQMALPVVPDPQAVSQWHHLDGSEIARPLFARGLCPLSARHIAAGSSPSTITIYDVEAEAMIAQAVLAIDVRNAIHGLAEIS